VPSDNHGKVRLSEARTSYGNARARAVARVTGKCDRSIVSASRKSQIASSAAIVEKTAIDGARACARMPGRSGGNQRRKRTKERTNVTLHCACVHLSRRRIARAIGRHPGQRRSAFLCIAVARARGYGSVCLPVKFTRADMAGDK